jgi:hypothetical protein
MIKVLEFYKGKVVAIHLKGDATFFYIGIIDKIDSENEILRIQTYKHYAHILITEIAVIKEPNPAYVTIDFDTHVVPNAFT